MFESLPGHEALCIAHEWPGMRVSNASGFLMTSRSISSGAARNLRYSQSRIAPATATSRVRHVRVNRAVEREMSPLDFEPARGTCFQNLDTWTGSSVIATHGEMGKCPHFLSTASNGRFAIWQSTWKLATGEMWVLRSAFKARRPPAWRLRSPLSHQAKRTGPPVAKGCT